MKRLFVLLAAISLSFIFICLNLSDANAETYWIAANGTQTSLSNCLGSTPLSGSSACAPTVNFNAAVAGDIVYFRAGTYTFTGNAINPTNSGTSGNRITFAAYDSEEVIFQGSSDWSHAVRLRNGQDYITVRGIRFIDFYWHMWIMGSSGNYATYNEIDSCTFSGMYDPTRVTWRGSTIQEYATYNWIHNSTFERYGHFINNDDIGVALEIGWDSGITDASYNVIENNIIQSSGHHVLGVQGYRNVVRNNYLQNDRWSLWEGNYYGCKVLVTFSRIPEEGWHLIEGNRVSFGDQSSETKPEGTGLNLYSRGCIIRQNVFDNNNENAIFIHKHCAGSSCTADENYIYNNTFWNNGHHLYDPSRKSYSHSILIWTGGLGTEDTDNVFKNNLFWNEANEADLTKSIASDVGFYPAHCEYANNYEGAVSGDPLFVNISGTPDPSNRYQFDFRFQSSSPAIDGGAHLTIASGSGSNSTTLVVTDARYFQDGWANGAGGGAVVHADWIAISTVANAVQIASINYDTNVITLEGERTWADGDSIWLHKKSDGEQVLYGSGPDIGAYEYEGSVPPGASGGITISGATLQ